MRSVKSRFGFPSRGDVDDHAEVPVQAARIVEQRLAAGHQPAGVGGVGVAHPPDALETGLGGHGLGHGGFCRLDVPLVDGGFPGFIAGLGLCLVQAVEPPDLVGPGVLVGGHVPVPGAGAGRLQGQVQLGLVGGQLLFAAPQVSGAGFHLLPQDADPGEHQPTRDRQHEEGNGHSPEIDMNVGIVRQRLPEPLVGEPLALCVADGRHAPLHQAQGLGVPLGDGAAELAGIEGEGLAVFILQAELVQVEVGRVAVEAEDPDVLPLGGGDQLGVTRVMGLVGDAMPGQFLHAGVPCLHPDPEALEVVDPGDTGDGLVAVEVDGQVGVGRREVIQGFPCRRLEDHVDDVGLARQDPFLGRLPLGGDEGDRHAGLAFPQFPVVRQVAGHLALVVAVKVGWVVVVGDDPQPGRCVCLSQGRHQAGQPQCQQDCAT